MKKFYIVTLFVILLQVCIFIGMSFPYSTEKNYQQVCKKYVDERKINHPTMLRNW